MYLSDKSKTTPMDDKDSIKLAQQMENIKLQKTSGEGKKIASRTESGSGTKQDTLSPDVSAKYSPIEGKHHISYDEKVKVMELLNKVSSVLRDTSSILLTEEMFKEKQKSVQSPQSADIDKDKIKRDLEEFLKSSEERLEAFKKYEVGKTEGKSILSSLDISEDVGECVEKLDHDKYPSVLSEVDAFLRKVDPILQSGIHKDDLETLAHSDQQNKTKSKAKKQTPLIENVDLSQKSLADLVMDLQNIESKELKEKVFKEVDRMLSKETDELTKLIDSLEDSVKTRSEAV